MVRGALAFFADINGFCKTVSGLSLCGVEASFSFSLYEIFKNNWAVKGTCGRETRDRILSFSAKLTSVAKWY